MVLPLIGALVVGAGTAAIQAYAAYEQGKITEAEYKRQIEAANKLKAELMALRPSESWQDINPQLLGEVAKYSPEIAGFVQENAPELIKEAKSDREKQVQRETLQKYAAMAETGRDVISDAQREQALFEADARAKQRQARLMEGLKRQGMLGTGAGLAAQLQGEQDEAIAARQATLQGVQEAEARRRGALSQAASLAGQMRGENLQVESANVNTMNAFNQRLANAKNLYNQYAANTRNEAQQLNQQRQMAREQYNLGLQNQYSLYNRQQREAAKERAREFDVGLTNRMFDLKGGAEKYRADGEARKIAGYGTAIASGLGAGMSAYGAFNAANLAESAAAADTALKGAQASYLGSLASSAGQGAIQGAAQELTSQSITPNASRQPLGLGIDYSQSNLTSSTPQRSEFVPANPEDIEINPIRDREMSFTPNYNQTMYKNPSSKYNVGLNSQTRNVFDLREELDPNKFMIQNPYAKSSGR